MSSDLVCLVVSLEAATERRRAITSALGDLGINFEFVNSVDARLENVSQRGDVCTSKLCDTLGRKLTNSEIACAIGHKRAYQRFLDSGFEYCLILEDDAILEPELGVFLSNRSYVGSGVVLLAHRMARVYRSTAIDTATGHQIFSGANSPVCACGYIVDRAAAKQLIDANTPVHSVTDWPIDLTKIGVRVVHPQIVRHPPWTPDESIIGSRPPKMKSRGASRLLRPDYWKQKWRKIRSLRVS